MYIFEMYYIVDLRAMHLITAIFIFMAQEEVRGMISNDWTSIKDFLLKLEYIIAFQILYKVWTVLKYLKLEVETLIVAGECIFGG